jgi:DNA-binding transcriptional ArsR family regulator
MTEAAAAASGTDRDIRSTLLVAVSHPVRQRALTILADRVASPSTMARELGLPTPGHVSYHVHELEKAGLVEIVGTRPVRGATEHLYRAVERPWLGLAEWEQLSAEERQEFSQYIVSLIVGDAATAFEAGTFDATPDRHLSRVPLQLDREGFAELSRMQDDLLDRALAIQAESDQRRLESGEDSVSAMTMMATFEMPSPPSVEST